MEVVLSGTRVDSRSVVRRCAQILDENKLSDIEIYEVGDTIQITDYFVIATGLTSRHLLTATTDLVKGLRADGLVDDQAENFHKEGHHGRDGRWVLLDLDSVVVHLFLEESRKYYDLELLWGDCPKIDWEPSPRPTASG
tara:strand:- start:1044 stop:1460 length:417 start_codon:yes stop_codon:yes gene_type:complete